MSHGTPKFLTLVVVAVTGASLSAFAPAARLALPGDLPRPLGQMTSGELFAVGAGLQWVNGPVQDRNCARGSCMGRIDAVRDQTPGPGNISANGTIVARLVNLGRDGRDDGPENRYGTRPGQQEFYIIALKDGDGWSWTVREAIRGSTDSPRASASGTWVTCRHDAANPAHPKGRSQFASCTSVTGDDNLLRASGPHLARDHATSLVPYNPLDPGWLSCTDGCCTAGQ